MYTRANLRIRLFLIVISTLFFCATLQTVGNHLVLRHGEEGDSVKSLYSKGLSKLHFVIYWFLRSYDVRFTPESGHSHDIVLNGR